MPASDSDVLRWMSQAYDEDSKGKRDKKKQPKWKMKINHWLTQLQAGEWVRESIATTVERTFTKHTRNAQGEIVVATVTELVYAHDGYRPKLEGEAKTRKAFYWRGARVWRD